MATFMRILFVRTFNGGSAATMKLVALDVVGVVGTPLS
jgi:hypothetical protein